MVFDNYSALIVDFWRLHSHLDKKKSKKWAKNQIDIHFDVQTHQRDFLCLLSSALLQKQYNLVDLQVNHVKYLQIMK